MLAEGYAATSLLSFYTPGVPVIEDGEPQRWTFRPPVETGGAGLAFGRPGFAAELAQRYAHVTPLAEVRRRTGGEELESYGVVGVEGGW